MNIHGRMISFAPLAVRYKPYNLTTSATIVALPQPTHGKSATHCDPPAQQGDES